MKIIFCQSLKNALRSKLTGIFVIISLTISMTILYLNISVTGSIIQNYETLLRSVYGNVDISVMSGEPFNFENTNLNGLRDEQVIKVYKINSELQGSTIDADTKSSVRFADVKKCVNYSLINLKNGNLDNFGEDSIVISEKLSADYNLMVGDDLKIIYSGREYIFEIAAIANTSGIYSLAEESKTIFANYDYLKNVIKSDTDTNIVSGLFIGLDNSENIDDICAKLQESNQKLIVQKNINSDELSNSMNSFRQIMLFVFIISALLNLFIIYSVLKLILLKRLPVIATYRSLGTTKFFAFQLICSENFIYASVAWVISIIISPGIRNMIINNYMGIGNKAIAGLSFSKHILYVLICFAFAITVLVFATVIITDKSKKMSIKEALFDKEDTQLKVSGVKFISGFLLTVISFAILSLNQSYHIMLSIVGMITFFLGAVMLIIPIYVLGIKILKKICDTFIGPYLRLSLNSIAQNKNIAGIIQMTSITLAFIFTIFILLSSVSTMFYEVSGSSRMDYRISGLGSHYDKVLKEVKEFADEIYIDYYTEAKLNEDKNMILLGYNPDECNWVNSIEMELIDLKPDEIILDEYFAVKNSLVVGDSVLLGNGHALKGTYRIAALLNSYKWNTSRNVGVIHIHEYMEKFSNIPTDISVSMGNEEKSEDLDKITFSNKAVLTNIKETLEYQRLSTDQLLKSVMILLMICILLGFVGIINNQILAMLNRRREIAIQYSVAMNKSNIVGALFLETVLVFFIICLSSVAIGMGMLCFSENVLYSAGIPMLVEIDMVSILKFAVSTLFMFGLNVIIPVRVVRSTNIVQEIRAE